MRLIITVRFIVLRLYFKNVDSRHSFEPFQEAVAVGLIWFLARSIGIFVNKEVTPNEVEMKI